uniref:Uncharacterized protein n=1 Tax=Chromera velia CCMP2878 TaxID=1169474 RepID=A0A0G4HEW7_9ALVE|eukprot:Cvel_26872.t1-p1 / transcript=Cvel_26872.t1 / gene=Cvel_26872 / organism=Chromera_velia_CCMP2878 / gene_product=Uncharacterized membrane protein STKORF319, putative / transcript_product=Uncharacterized membrane protein STKORF319, putative / location=Cvel_scaffold3263:6056-11051(-) / protein_length=326 / sequence_SO=supercontig / SO=protein_coding / is_pseudo=false
MLDLDAEALEAFPEDTLKDIEDAASRLALYAGAAAFFGVGVWLLRSSDAGLEFFASYLTEYSLSIDNLFVFLIIFRYFKVPVLAQEKVLNYGIGTAALLRFSFLYLGVEILEKFKPAFLIFAVILIGNSLKTLYSVWKGDDEDEDEDLSDNKIVQLAKAVIPFQDKFDGDRFFATTIEEQDVTLESGETKRQRKLKVRATPLLLALIVIELSDILFATDSVPAVLGITTDVFVAYTSNLFAVFGLRSLYFLLAEGLTNLTMLEPAIGLVMGFIGAKIVFEFMGYEVSTATELLVVGGLLGGGVGLSMLTKEGEGNDEQTSTPSGKS